MKSGYINELWCGGGKISDNVDEDNLLMDRGGGPGRISMEILVARGCDAQPRDPYKMIKSYIFFRPRRPIYSIRFLSHGFLLTLGKLNTKSMLTRAQAFWIAKNVSLDWL